MAVDTSQLASGIREGGNLLIDNRQISARQISTTCYEMVSARKNIKQSRGTEGL